MKDDKQVQEQPDVLMKLFRKITDKELKLNPGTWISYLNDYIRKLHPDREDDMERVFNERSVSQGNANATFQKKNTLTFKKLLTGLFILKATKIRITLDIHFYGNKNVTVSEEIIINEEYAKLEDRKGRKKQPSDE